MALEIRIKRAEEYSARQLAAEMLADAVGSAVPGDLPVAALRPFHAGAGRGHGRHLRRPVPRADGPARGHPGAEPRFGPRSAPPRHPAEPVGARQAGRDEVPLAPRRVQAPVDGLKLAKLDETSLAALSSNGQKIRADCFSGTLFLLSLSSALARSLQRDSDLVKLETREATPSKSRANTAAVAGFLAKKRQARPFIYSSRIVFGQQRLNHETLVQFADACAVCRRLCSLRAVFGQ